MANDPKVQSGTRKPEMDKTVNTVLSKTDPNKEPQVVTAVQPRYHNIYGRLLQNKKVNILRQ